MKLSIEKLKELLPDAKLDGRGKNLKAKCPNCGENEFGISLNDNHPFGCYRKAKCGFYGNIFTLAKFLNRLDILRLEGNVGNIEKLNTKLLQSKPEEINLELPEIKFPLGFKRTFNDEYLNERGFKEYKKYKVGRTSLDPKLKSNYIIIGIKEENKLKGYIARHIWSKKKIDEQNKLRKKKGLPQILRYRNSETDFSKLLMGYDEIKEGTTKTIIAVEGVFDKFNIDKVLNLHKQDEIKCNCTFKCAVSFEQIVKWKLKGIENIILFYDPDVIKSINKAATDLQLYFNVLIAFNNINSNDAGDITESEAKIIFNNLKSVSQFFSNYLLIKDLVI